MTAEQWKRTVTWTAGQQTPAHVVPRSRLAEVLVHHVDLAVGYPLSAWPAGFVQERLDGVVAALNRRRLAPESFRLQATDSGRTFVLHGAAPGERAVLGVEVQLLAWLLGRSTGADLRLIFMQDQEAGGSGWMSSPSGMRRPESRHSTAA